ncbi:MAG: SDR family NAD(P)-dependent oxidoreductase [Anaerolineaceae bacterium]|nr:SDR family NAD(P)-dependent oxidoreductase [Anaerolineaceae bacterium]
MNTYVVTGSSGFIGAKVSEFLLADGHTVIGLDNMNDAYDIRMKEWRLNHLKQFKNYHFFQMDICDYAALEKIFSQFSEIDAVINLAARAGVRKSVEDPWLYLQTNTTGTLNLLELCKRNGIKKFLLASTSSIYGQDAPMPTPETASSDYPLQPYSASKKGAEAMCHAYHYLHGIDVSIVRFFTVYGPVGRPDMVMFRFVKWIYEDKPLKLNGDGEQTRGFTYVDDIARGVIQALKPVGYEIINLGGHEVISINQLITHLEGLIGKKAVVEYCTAHPADMRGNCADVTKAKELLGWQAQVNLEEGIQHLVSWYQQEREWAKQVSTE